MRYDGRQRTPGQIQSLRELAREQERENSKAEAAARVEFRRQLPRLQSWLFVFLTFPVFWLFPKMPGWLATIGLITGLGCLGFSLPAFRRLPQAFLPPWQGDLPTINPQFPDKTMQTQIERLQTIRWTQVKAALLVAIQESALFLMFLPGIGVDNRVAPVSVGLLGLCPNLVLYPIQTISEAYLGMACLFMVGTVLVPLTIQRGRRKIGLACRSARDAGDQGQRDVASNASPQSPRSAPETRPWRF